MRRKPEENGHARFTRLARIRDLLSKETESKIHGFAKGKIISQRLNYARDAASHQSSGRRRAVPQNNLSRAGWSWGCIFSRGS